MLNEKSDYSYMFKPKDPIDVQKNEYTFRHKDNITNYSMTTKMAVATQQVELTSKTNKTHGEIVQERILTPSNFNVSKFDESFQGSKDYYLTKSYLRDALVENKKEISTLSKTNKSSNAMREKERPSLEIDTSNQVEIRNVEQRWKTRNETTKNTEKSDRNYLEIRTTKSQGKTDETL